MMFSKVCVGFLKQQRRLIVILGIAVLCLAFLGSGIIIFRNNYVEAIKADNQTLLGGIPLHC